MVRKDLLLLETSTLQVIHSKSQDGKENDVLTDKTKGDGGEKTSTEANYRDVWQLQTTQNTRALLAPR